MNAYESRCYKFTVVEMTQVPARTDKIVIAMTTHASRLLRRYLTQEGSSDRR